MSSLSIPVTLIPTATVPYFHAEALQQRFARDLSDAVLAEHIDEDEARWLRTLLSPSALAQAVDPPRVERVIMTSGVPAGVELAAAVLISHEASSNPRVYLSTLLYGLEPFKDREQLLATLQARFGSRTGVVPEFDEQLIEGPLFEQRMLTIIDQQAEKIDDVATHLQQLPSLQTVLRYALGQRIETAMSGIPIDPSTHLLQIVQATTQPSEAVVAGVQTLADATLDEYIGRAVPQGHERRFLNSRGQTLDQQETQQYQRVLSDTARALQTPFETRLGHFWWSPIGHGQTRREYAADALSDRFRQELFARRQDATLEPHEFRRLSALLDPSVAQWGDGGPVRVKKLTLAADDQDPLKLVGVFLIESVVPHLPEVLFYSVEKGLRRFRNRLALEDYFSTAAGRIERLHYLSLNDHALLRGARTVQLNVEDIDRPLFQDRIDSIIALQQRNLAFAIAQPHTDRERAAVMIDDALDIRRLIDRRLLRLGGGRWREGEGIFDDTWLQTPSVQPPPVPPTVAEAFSPLLSWLEQVQTLDDNAQRIWKAHPGIESCARDVLNKQLAILGEGQLDARDIQVQLIEALPVEALRAEAQSLPVVANPVSAPIGLIALLLNRVSGHRLADVPAASRILITSSASSQPESTTLLTPLLINHLLARAHGQFSATYTRQTTEFHSRALRQADTQIHPGPVSCGIREALLRLELDLKRRLANLDEQTLGMLEQVLNRPVRTLREALGYAIVDVYAVSLIYGAGDDRSSAPMSNVFLLHQTFRDAHSVVLWSPLNGLRVFDSLEVAKRSLMVRLILVKSRDRWLDLFAEPDKVRIRQHLEHHVNGHQLSIDVHRLDGHFIEQLQHAEQNRQYQGIENASQFAEKCHFKAEVFSNVMTAAETDDRAGQVLDSLSIAIQNALFEALMPTWMKTASIEDLSTYVDILTRYCMTNDPDHDFLAGIPNLKEYAREQLLTQLSIDFPDQPLDPDTLGITLTRYEGTPVGTGFVPSSLAAATITNSETLTEYALDHFSSIQGASLSVTSTEGGPASTLLTPTYVRAMVHKLDLGAGFQTLLAQKLDKNNPDFATRRDIFFQQWPALLLGAAFQQKLEGQLSATAYDYIKNVLDMPDGLARQSVHDEDIILRPVQLIPKAGAAPDTVPGCYLIGPKDPVQGPVILYAVFHQDFTFKEYADEAQLLQDIRTSNSLQALFMQRVTPDAQARYGHHSFLLPPVWRTEFYSDFPMFSLGPVTLSVEPISGNVLKYLFEDTLEVLKDMAKKQTVTTAQADWESFTYLMTLQGEQILMFMPGRIGLLVAGWQSLQLLQASVVAASSQRWGKALSEFTAALSVFVSARQSALEELAIDEPELDTLAEAVPLPEFSWRNAQLPAELKARLQVFEVPDIALRDLAKDELFNVYQDPTTQKKYAAVAGKVYQVQQFQGQWNIVSADKKGPNLRLNEHQQWEINLQWGLRGGGGAFSRSRTSVGFTVSDVDAEVNQEFSVQATGMRTIRMAYRQNARRISRAHRQATRYLNTCLDNLNAQQPRMPLDTEVNRIIGEFFGVQTPSAGLVGEIKHAVTVLFNAVMDPSLSPYSSPRFVVGLNKLGYQDTVAFTLKIDPLKRVFLSEGFFQVHNYQLKPPALGSAGFSLSTHFRAAALLHELSHLANDTYDIAYLDASAPFLDLLADDSPGLKSIKADLEEVQQRYLSHRTSPNQLFKRFDKGRWRDLSDHDDEGKQFILTVTGQPGLAEARADFLADVDKRSKIMLGNADSLTLLVLLLGRRRFASTP